MKKSRHSDTWWNRAFLLLLILCNSLFISIRGELTRIIVTDSGPVRGEIRRTASSSTLYSSFKGIPYAKPPVGNLRFKPPEKIQSWNKTFLATSFGNMCPQFDNVANRYEENEDCLNLNVYTPNFDLQQVTDRLLPVLVYFFGGQFKFGSASHYPPDYFIDENIIFVVMNFRLGAFGLLALDHPDATGNVMLKDQNFALKWVNTNIIKFGGDPNKVTIWGRSSTASCIDLHLISKMSQGLFRHSISMSGGALTPWGFSTPEEAKNRAFKLGELLGIKTDDKNELLEELHKKSAKEIIIATNKVVKGDRVFKPTIENDATAGNSSFLSDCPVKLFKNGQFLKLPHLTGFVPNEIMIFANSVENLLAQTRYALFSMDPVIKNNKIGDELSSFAEHLSNASKSNLGLSSLPDEFVINGINTLSDILTVSAMDTKQQLMTRNSPAPVFYYRFAYNAGEHALHKVREHVKYDGVAHGDEYPYIMETPMYKIDKLLNPNEPSLIIRKRMVKMWMNFIKYGNPTPIGSSDPLFNITWPASGKQGIRMDITDELSVIGERTVNENVKIVQEAHHNSVFEKLTGCICDHP